MPSASPENVRVAKLFRNNRSQAVRIPAEFEFSGDHVLIRKDGHKLVIEPGPRRGLADVLGSLTPLAPEDDFPSDAGATLLPVREVDL